MQKKNIQVGLLYIDLRKAFDSVLYTLLCMKLSKIGIKNNELLLLKSYLNNRKQYIKINNYDTSERLVECGVPQGAILSPTLFNIFINDVPKLPLKGKMMIYADDICTKYENHEAKCITKDIESDLKLLDMWFKVNKLSLNI